MGNIDWQAKEAEAKTAAFNIWTWGHAHTFAAGLILGVIADRVFRLFFF